MTLRAYRCEWLILTLIALATLPLVSVIGAQDTSRLALASSIVQRGKVDIDPYWRLTIDRAFAHGHWYSDKAPGVALIAVPAVAVSRLADAIDPPSRTRPIWRRSIHLWLLRIWCGGLALLGLTFLVGRAAEGLVRGTGGATAVTFGLGTMAGSLGPTVFGHLPDALALFSAFIIATRAKQVGSWAWVGLLVGTGVLFEYPAALAGVILLIYALRRGGLRAGLAALAGAVPPGLVLGAYDWLAFGAPWRLSYHYVDNVFSAGQQSGFFGIGAPSWHGLSSVFFDGHGLLLVSPVLAAGAAGLVMLGRRRKGEAVVAAAIAAVFIISTVGYFLPNGGLSPGPRFATVALPFLALGLPFAFARWKWTTIALAGFSVGTALFDELTWSVANSLRFEAWPRTVWSIAGASSEGGCILLLACGGAAALLVGTGLFQGRLDPIRTLR